MQVIDYFYLNSSQMKGIIIGSYRVRIRIFCGAETVVETSRT